MMIMNQELPANEAPPATLSESPTDFCGICGTTHVQNKCALIQIKSHMRDEEIPTKARLTLPKKFRLERMSEGSLSIIANEVIEKGTQFGPLIAQKVFTLNPEILFPLKIFTTNDYFNEYFLDLTDEHNCNWLMFLNAAQNLEEQNVMCYQDKTEIYYVTIKNILPGEFLKVWYSPFYAKKMNKMNLESHLQLSNDFGVPKDMNKLLKKQQNIVNRENWTCKFCGIIETNITKFAAHISDHYTKQLRKICEICKATFLTRKGLKKHLKIVHGPKICEIDKVTKNKSAKDHVKDSLVGGPLLNEVLTESLDNSNILLQQTDMEQFDIGNIDNSNMLLDSENLGVDHLLTDNVKYLEHFNFDIDENQEQFLCDICLKSFSKLKLLVQHLKRHTGKYMCPHCLMIFCNNENLRAHSCFNINQKQHKCDLCNRKFSLKKYLSRHIKAIHYKKFQCKNCMKTYFSNKETKEHNCPAVPLEEKEKYSCLICNKVFLRDVYLKKHMKCHENKEKNVSELEKKFMCEICAKTFTKISNLNKHFKNHMSPNFKCTICGKEFFRKDVLENHVLVAHKKEQFKCKECNKAFKSLKYLKIHVMQHGEKNYQCLECNMTFVYRSNLTKHKKRMHDKIADNNEARFVCPVCKKCVKYKTSLLRHMRNNHPNSNVETNLATRLKKPTADDGGNQKEEDVIKSIDLLNYNDLSDFPENLINTLNDNNILSERISECGQEEINDVTFDDNLNLQNNSVNKEICLSMPDIPEVEQQIMLSESAYIMDNGTIVQPLDQSNVILYILDKGAV